ncbi:hypothetical protein HUS23_08695 [Ectothiorhodospiraceae bacterium 2226]|nr:hypothetical protein HUS23_08695 [Ectothiorhodospiraceae bacterium 2226]
MTVARRSIDSRIRPHHAGGGHRLRRLAPRRARAIRSGTRFQADFPAFHERYAEGRATTVPRDHGIVHGTRY